MSNPWSEKFLRMRNWYDKYKRSGVNSKVDIDSSVNSVKKYDVISTVRFTEGKVVNSLEDNDFDIYTLNDFDGYHVTPRKVTSLTDTAIDDSSDDKPSASPEEKNG